MKSVKRFILGTACVSALALTGCIDEADVTYYGTDDQLSSSSKATEALLWAMPAFTNNLQTLGSKSGDYDWGYGSIMHIRDVMTEEMTVAESGYDHYSAWEHNQYIGPNYMSTQFIWYYFWKQVQTTNNLIGAIDPESASETQLGYLGTAYAFRAFTYLDMARMFEFLENDGKLGKGLIFFADTSAPYLTNLYDFLEQWGIAVGEGILFETNSQNYMPDDPTTLGSYPATSDDDIVSGMNLFITGYNIPLTAAFDSQFLP